MTTTIYSVEELKTKKTLVKNLSSIGEAVKFIKDIGRSLSEFKIISNQISYTKSVLGKNLLISGMSDEDINIILKGKVLPIYNNPSQIDECDNVIVFSKNNVLIGKLKSKEKYSIEAAPFWKNIEGKYGYDNWNTNLFFENSMIKVDRNNFESKNFKLKGTQGGVGYKNYKLDLEF